MNVNEQVYDLLINESTVTDLVSTRIYHDHLPKSYTLPALVFKTRLVDTVRTLDSVVIAEEHICTIYNYAEDPISAFELSQAVNTFLIYYKGANIDDIELQRDTQPFEYQTKDYVIITEFTISKTI